jgi:RNA polymerase sigma-70 factor (ECF subfamily)
MDMPATPGTSGPAEALSRLAAGRDVEAWRWLVEELGDAIRRTTGRLSDDGASADDAAQEALLTIRDHARSFRPRAAPDEDARRWVLRVAANAALALRRSRRRARARDVRGASAGEVEGDAAGGIEREETARLVRDALAALAEPERTAIVLRVVEGLGYDQIAAELRCAEGTAKSRVSRGLERLRGRLGRREAVASIAALLAQPRCEGALAATAQTLIHVPHGAHIAAVPATLGGLSMAAKLGIALALVAAVATPVALHGQGQEAPAPVPASAAPTAAKANPASADHLAAMLDRHVTFDFQETSFVDAMSFIGQITKLPYVIAPDVRASGGATVTLKVSDMRAGDALEWLCKLANVHATTGDSFVFITSQAGVPIPKLDSPAAVHDQLKQRVSLDFAETPVGDAVDFLRRFTPATIVVEPRAIEAKMPISFSAKDVPVEIAFEMLCASGGLKMVSQNGALSIAMPDTQTEPKTLQPGH